MGLSVEAVVADWHLEKTRYLLLSQQISDSFEVVYSLFESCEADSGLTLKSNCKATLVRSDQYCSERVPASSMITACGASSRQLILRHPFSALHGFFLLCYRRGNSTKSCLQTWLSRLYNYYQVILTVAVTTACL